MEVTFVKVEVLLPEEYIETLRNELNEIYKRKGEAAQLRLL